VVQKAQAVLTDAAAEHALEIKRRADVQVAHKTFKDAIRGTRTTRRVGVGGGNMASAASVRGARNTSSGNKMPERLQPSPRKKKQNRSSSFAEQQHDINLQAIRSMKAGATVRSIAGFLRHTSA
jgi:hypothetical protein